MAEKSFGIKELNVIGSSGTPQIQSVENLNIRVGVGSTVIIGDSNSDFTSPAQVDSNNTTVLNVGIVTANYFYGSLISPGIATFYGDANTYLSIQNNDTNSMIAHTNSASSGLYLQSNQRVEITNEDATKVGLRFNLGGNHEVELFHNHVKRLETTGAGVSISGMLTASGITTVTGDTLFTKQLSVSGLSTYIGVATYKSDVFVDGTLTAGAIDGGTY